MQSRDRDVVILNFGRCAPPSDAVVWLPTEKILITGRPLRPLRDRRHVAVRYVGVEGTRSTICSISNRRSSSPDAEPRWARIAGGTDSIGSTGLRTHVEDGLLAGSRPGSRRTMTRGGFKRGRRRAPDTATETFRAVYDEIAGLRPPWPLMEERNLRAGPSPTSDTPGWIKPRKVLWRNSWPDRLAMLSIVAPGVEIVPFQHRSGSAGV